MDCAAYSFVWGAAGFLAMAFLSMLIWMALYGHDSPRDDIARLD